MSTTSAAPARLVGLFLLAVLLFNYPLLAAFGAGSIGGIPLIYVYLFAAWLAVIVLAALVLRRVT